MERIDRVVLAVFLGPSIVDLPAGCWMITARWAGGEDELQLSYDPS